MGNCSPSSPTTLFLFAEGGGKEEEGKKGASNESRKRMEGKVGSITAKPKRKQGRRKTRTESCSKNSGGIFFIVLRLKKLFEVYTIALGFRNSSSNNSIKTKKQQKQQQQQKQQRQEHAISESTPEKNCGKEGRKRRVEKINGCSLGLAAHLINGLFLSK